MKHTPGPWKITKNNYTRLVFVGNGDREYPLYKADPSGYGDAQSEADARLIAAAPELLNALTELFGLLEENEPAWYLRSHYNHAKAAIVKATG